MIFELPSHPAQGRWCAQAHGLGYVRAVEQRAIIVQLAYATNVQPPILITTDKNALSIVLVSHPLDFPKPSVRSDGLPHALSQGGYTRQRLHRQVSKPDASGLLFSEGEAWRRQRKIMVIDPTRLTGFATPY